jgi:hypothetical protein
MHDVTECLLRVLVTTRPNVLDIPSDQKTQHNPSEPVLHYTCKTGNWFEGISTFSGCVNLRTCLVMLKPQCQGGVVFVVC